MRDRRLARDLVLLFLGQVLLLTLFRAALPAGVAANEGSDYDAFYRPVAEQIADGHGVVFGDDRTPATRYPPGYPLLLGATFTVADATGAERQSLVTPLTIVMTAVAGVLLHLVARRIFDRRHAWVASVAWLAYPLTLWTTKQPNSEIPFLVLLYGVVLLLVPPLGSGRAGWRRLAAAGALLGVAAVVRPAGLLLVPGFALVLWLRLAGGAGERTRRAGTFVAACAVPVLAVSAWMSTAAGTPVLLSDANDANLVEGLSFAVDSPAEAEDLPMPGGLRDFVVETHAREGELLRDGSARSYLGEALRERPVVVGQLVAYKAARSWYGTESFRFEGALLLTQLAWVGTAVVGAVAARRRSPAGRWYVWLVLALTGCAWLAAIGALSIVRYLVPTLGLFAPLVAVAVLSAADAVAVRRGRARGTAPRPEAG
ncbi:MAG: glycosyltransferase family 39 protein [Acidimicrobiales bacterium]|nr:glycosyltransferase family 39 protein [Acidimicrobiales bacterium]